jgi:outer membrane lipoprotein SlyB
MAKRVGLAHLKESLQDIYGGEIIIVGNADIRPHDMVYLADVYERMYGLFEVEQVVHHFTPEMGYITSITPNALVTINDPSRWYMTSWLHSWFATQNMRNRARIHIQNAIATNSIAANNRYANIDSIFEALEPEMRGSVYYTHGQSSLVKDIMSMEAANNSSAINWAMGSAAVAATAGTAVGLGAGLIAASAATAVVGSLAWKGWKWIRDNTLDQHGCYISYLNKNGQPMDAGLSQNQGMAVGMFHSKSLLPGILGVRSQVTTPDGYSIIRNDDLLKSLGWSEIQIEDLVRYISFENAEIHAKVLGLSGLGPDRVLLDRYFRVLARVIKVLDGDTVEVEDILSGQKFRVRFSGIDTAESNIYTVYDDPRPALGTVVDQDTNLIFKDSPSGKATLFTANALRNKVFTLRVNPTRSDSLTAIAEEDYSPGSTFNVPSQYQKDKFGQRVLGTFFYKTSNENRANIISYISNIFRTTLSSSGQVSNNPNDYREKVRLETYSETVFYSRFYIIYDQTMEAVFSADAAVGFLEDGFLSEFVEIASKIPSISQNGQINDDMFRAFVTLINMKILEATYEKASEWPLVLWDDYYSDGSPVTLNWELVVNGLARVYTGELNTLAPSAELGLE